MVSGSTLRTSAGERGIQLPLFPRRECLEPLDRLDGFRPIGFSQVNFTPETAWMNPDPSWIVWREERNFEPWHCHGWYFADRPDVINVGERYSLWQLLNLDDALTARESPVSTRVLAGQARPEDVVASARVAAEARLAQLDDEWQPLIKLLTALQPRSWPYRKQSSTLLSVPDGDGPPLRVDPLGVAKMRFDPRAIVARFGMSLDQLAQLHLWIAEQGRRIDPMPEWYRLAEAAPRRVTDELRGESMRARDFYDAAYLLRGLYF